MSGFLVSLASGQGVDICPTMAEAKESARSAASVNKTTAVIKCLLTDRIISTVETPQ